VKKGARITGPARTQLIAQLVRGYTGPNPQSIRALAEATGRSYGFVQRVLADEPTVTVRPRGGAHRRRSTNPATARTNGHRQTGR
jgi:predicted transcriptional regulator